MASSGKKNKKPKGKTIALTEFLADGASGTPQPAVRSKAWADEVENDDDMYDMGSRNKQPVILPTAPRATRSPNVDDENIPRNPPFNAYISNLQYDVDEEEIADFFKDMKIVNVRLPRDERGGGRLKGFGYVEFESRESLIAALNIGDTTVKGRRMRIEVASNSDNERRRPGMRDMGYDMSRDRGDGPDRTLGDWRSGPRDESESSRRGSGDRSGSRDNAETRDRGSFTRDNMDGPPARDRGSFTRDNMDGPPRGSFTRDNMDGPPRGSFTRDNMDGPSPRDRGSFTRDNMDGPPRGSFTRDNMSGPPPSRERERGSYFSRDNADGQQPRDRGSFTRDNMDSGFSRRDGPGGTRGRERGSGFRGGYGDRGGGGDQGKERFSDRGGSFGQRRDEQGDGPPLQQSTPSERPKLNLAQRTVPDAGDEPVVAQAAIFGGAKPVDTAAREREIEERLAKQQRPSEPVSKPVVAAEGAEKKEGGSVTAAPPSENAWQSRAQQNQDAVATTGSRESYSRKQYTERDDHASARGGPGGGTGRGAHRGAPPRGGGAERPVRAARPDPKPERDEVSRMPKLREQAAPNFIASNKYGVLPSEEDSADVSD